MEKLKTAKLPSARPGLPNPGAFSGLLRLALAMAIVLLGVELALANGVVELPRHVLSGGASDASASGGVSVHATLGQPMIGPSGQGSYDLCAGFWCGTAIEYTIYLPLTLRNM